MLNYFFGLFSHDLAIDLGTVNTLVYVKGKGIAIREPSVVARHRKSKKILAIGTDAKRMQGKTPIQIEAFRPLKDGVIADFDATEAMLHHYITLVHENHSSFLPIIPRPKVVVGIPSGVTEVERRAVQDACLSAGARIAYLIEEPMAAAIGANLPVSEAKGSMIVDIGGGTTEIAVISLGGIVINKSLRIAGDELDDSIVSYVRLKHSLLMGLPSSELVKKTIGSAHHSKEEKHMVVRGRDLENGLPKSVRLSSAEVREAMASVINQIIEMIDETVEEIPPELVGDVMEQGITLAGGGALLDGIDKAISEATKMPVWVVEDPLTCVVRGAARLLDNKSLLDRVRVTGGLK
ncbi:rod shape-determining protein [Candidatus Gottesmanbacteria bacterium CG11_big_fil_rev_8_21_14_0_20_37_11]|uniref:Cell shape-determining protein MreB n=3 Tax=Candidatus Gottesmaniibacteriota TaxID=1752720 RepID=A0A2M7RSL2_9BACT|nr:MAG: rod shape-determining protein [Candidatus Gottesmanbacteria bacterium CG1_02_37_22]PIP32944.1 MAG: rod shape-determining protein [Candidatus Gottesmanbacteria bacterium CG23_combo_of_CG06-09_8_20_14_all_37_19]PIR08646.1 MAG: rod shape-determining protein [Candidatus Gottesmanbacteria bacterium CG11_big_fil_rev_8_21_14_0_20_37_11]PIZ03019.1 MAG: rod shape-determining protein [Candidatus Gottesmanbacteria bacterium CG_4_10_14_0_8_um_filter_37_24]